MKYEIILLILFHSAFAQKNYTGYTLLRTLPLNKEHVEFLKNVSQVIKIDYWRPPGAVQKPVDMLVAPEDKTSLKHLLEENGYYYTTVMDDVQQAFDEQTVKPYIRRIMSSFDFKNFYQLGDIYNWLKDLSNERPDDVEIIKIGETYEKRDILAVKVVLDGSRKRSTVIVEGGVHAREWISPAFVCYLIQNIVYHNQSADPELKKIALLYEWYFVPVLNPDGYVYSFERDRLWRKNRRSGYGTDINRNFDSSWGNIGISKHTGDETYCGSYAFSEKESIAIKDLVEKVKDRLEYYLAFHSYGQYLILPYAYSAKHTDNYEEMNHILNEVSKSISRKFGIHYTSGTSFETLGYLTSGVSACWVKAVHRVPYAVTFELRDSGVYGFALPPNQILPTCEETLEGLKVLLEPRRYFKKLDDVELFNRQSRCFLEFVVGLFSVIFFVVKLNIN